MKKIVSILALLILAGCGGSSQSPSSPYPGRPSPAPGAWTDYGSGAGAALVGNLSNPFAIPSQASGKTVNYVYTAPPALAIGRTVTLNYSIDGNATLAPLPESSCGSGGCGSANLRLFIWGNTPDTSNDRWWCAKPVPLTIGDNQTLSCVIDSTWTGTGLAGYNQTTFPNSVINPFAIGFTFGAMFAGHGVWTTSGTATFKINSFTVQ